MGGEGGDGARSLGFVSGLKNERRMEDKVKR